MEEDFKDGFKRQSIRLPRKDPKMDDEDDQDSNADLDFVYADADTHANEVAELYSYTEQPEFQLNVKAFEETMEQQGLSPVWTPLPDNRKKALALRLLDQLDVSDRTIRMRAARCTLYLLQGCWAEAQSDTDQAASEKANILLLYNTGAFHAFVDLLSLETESSSAGRKCAVSIDDSTDLRVILSTLYLFIEGMRSMEHDEDAAEDVASFRSDLWLPFGGELLASKLLSMVLRFTQGGAGHLPMKKVLLVLWKTLLMSLGGSEYLWQEKQNRRAAAGLPPLEKDTIEVVKTLRSSSPPTSAVEALDSGNKVRRLRRALVKQSSLDEPMDLDAIQDPDDDFDESPGGESPPPASPRCSTPLPSPAKGLPWTPKVRGKDLDAFLDATRVKFVGFQVENDRETLAGLPLPIHEGVRILKQHIYRSLSEIQIEEEEKAARTPFLAREAMSELNSAKPAHAELLYRAIFAQAPQYMIALLKILLAASPTAKSKTDSLNIMVDVLPKEMPMTVVQSMKLSTDVARHKEIVTKAVAAILLLLLKHFKLNHIYQFEFIAQHMVFANCVPLVLKFFNQNIMTYIKQNVSIPLMEFPACVIGDPPELTAESCEVGGDLYSWRNLFTCINLLRILNKLTKYKHSRIMMLVAFKSAPILKRCLRVRHAMMQMYVLKLIKMQIKYLGRQWRKCNTKTMSAIYQKVRHRLGDDWAYGNDIDAKPWDFQAEELKLRSNVDRFNTRLYASVPEPDYTPLDNCAQSVLGQPVELTDHFKNHYNLWLHQEVFANKISWDQLLIPTYM